MSADVKNPKPLKPGESSSIKSPGQAAPVKVALSPEAELSLRIKELEDKLNSLKQEVKTLQGKMVNRDPVLMHKMQKENEQAKVRIEKLRKALFAIICDSLKPRQADEANLQLNVLRQMAVEYFKKVNVAPELWKNIVS